MCELSQSQSKCGIARPDPVAVVTPLLVERDVAFVPESELVALLKEAGFSNPLRFYQTYLFGGWVVTRDV